MKELEILNHIWLPHDASKIYLSLLRYGDANISKISRISKVHRPTIYKFIPYLQELWLVSEAISWKRKLYSAEHPRNLNNLFEYTKQNFEATVDTFEQLFEQKTQSKPQLKTIQWDNFAKVIFDDIGNTLWKDETYFRYSSVTSLEWQEKYTHYKSLRDKKNIQRMIITSDFLSKNKPKRLDHDVAVIPKNYDMFDDNISKVIYDDKVWIIDYNNQVSFILQDKKLATFEKKIFKLFFKFLR